MAKIVWDDISRRTFKYGVSKGVLYKWDGDRFTNGVAWNGLVSVTDKPSGKEKTALYSGDILRGYELSAQEYGGEIKAVMYPPEFISCLGYGNVVRGIYVDQQEPEMFAFSYQVGIDDNMHRAHRPDIHLVYNCIIADQVSFSHETFGSKQYEEMTFPFVSLPIETGSFYPTSHIVIRGAHLNHKYDEQYADLLTILYGNENRVPEMPMPSALIEMFRVKKPALKYCPKITGEPTAKGIVIRDLIDEAGSVVNEELSNIITDLLG